MRVAIPNWNGRVSPVFDVAKALLLVDLDGGRAMERRELLLPPSSPRMRAASVAGTGANVLICEAISRPLEVMLVASGVRVIPNVCGTVEQVLAAYASGRLSAPTFQMPGCRRRGRRGRGPARGRRGRGPQGFAM